MYPLNQKQIETALLEFKVRTLARRETTQVHSSPLQLRDNGELGTYTVQIGANESERMITVYNKRGYTRLEFQVRDNRSDAIARELLNAETEEWYAIMLSHLLDFIEFDTDWWRDFVKLQGRANRKVTTAKEVTSERVINWLDNQVSPALSAVNDAYSEDLIKRLIERGRKRRGGKYNALFLSEHEPDLDK